MTDSAKLLIMLTHYNKLLSSHSQLDTLTGNNSVYTHVTTGITGDISGPHAQ